jgi:gamma-glutamylcyclotransferase (GGCT)/AIG2-like uncharacterized protein YtfP
MNRLFIYGSLQPGGPNEHVLGSVDGEWEPAVIKGKLIDSGWGASLGYPGLVIDDEGVEIPGYVFSSPNLQSKWDELDELEGRDYERTIAEVALANGSFVRVHVYILRD